jgi:hypothetical protein
MGRRTGDVWGEGGGVWSVGGLVCAYGRTVVV